MPTNGGKLAADVVERKKSGHNRAKSWETSKKYQSDVIFRVCKLPFTVDKRQRSALCKILIGLLKFPDNYTLLVHDHLQIAH